MSGEPCEECGEWIDRGLENVHECTLKSQLERERRLSADLASRLRQAQDVWAQEMRVTQAIRVVLENYEADEHLSADRALGHIYDLVNP